MSYYISIDLDESAEIKTRKVAYYLCYANKFEKILVV